MAHDEALAGRLREALQGEDEVTEKRMFGGLAFLVGGKLAIGASGQGGLMVRVEPALGDGLVAEGAAVPMEMRGRPMAGWLRVPSADVADPTVLATWVERGVAAARAAAASG
jgi:TfoX/Sxy family transcriptional regulator of competence genes